MCDASKLVASARERIIEIEPLLYASEEAATVLIDVREPDEFASGHLPGAVNIPRGVIEFQAGSNPALLAATAPIVLYCRSGGRSALAALSLSALGFENVRSLTGGIMGWIGVGFPIAVAGTDG